MMTPILNLFNILWKKNLANGVITNYFLKRNNDLRKVILLLINKNPDTDEVNAYVLVSSIDLHNTFIASIELEWFNPGKSIIEDVMDKAQNYSRTIFNSDIYLECNSKKVNYTLKASIVYKVNNHFIVYAIKERKIEEDKKLY